MNDKDKGDRYKECVQIVQNQISLYKQIILNILFFRKLYNKKLFLLFKKHSSEKTDLYAEAEVIPEDSSHYQELNLSEK